MRVMKIEVQNETVTRALADLAGRLTDMSAPMRAIAAILEENVRRRFATETDPEGKRWAPHAPATVQSYPKQGNRRLLDRYGDMLRSLNSQSDATSATIGFSAVTSKHNGQRTAYAVYHEFGTKKMPARKMLFADPKTGQIAPADETEILKILTHHLTP